METDSNKKNIDVEIHFLGDSLILNHDGNHSDLTDKINEISKGLIPAIQNMYYEISNNKIDSSYKGKEKITQSVSNIKLISSAIPLDELLKTEFPEARWIVNKLFESGTINMISAPPNKWKSWIVILCAICVSSGKNLFDMFQAEKTNVLIVNEEDNARLLQERCNMLMEKPEDLPIYFHIGEQIKLEEDFVDEIINEARQKNISLIIFDSLRSVHDADENSSKEMQLIMDQLKRITREGITVIFTHHNRKKARGNNSDISGEESRGSSAINAAIHGHLSLEELDKNGNKYLVVYQQKLKAGPKMIPFEVEIKENEENHKISFVYNGLYKAEEKEFNKVYKKITSILKEDEGLTVNDLKDMSIGSETMIRTVLKIMESKEELMAQTRKQIEGSHLKAVNYAGKHNEKVYFKINSNYDNLG